MAEPGPAAEAAGAGATGAGAAAAGAGADGPAATRTPATGAAATTGATTTGIAATGTAKTPSGTGDNRRSEGGSGSTGSDSGLCGGGCCISSGSSSNTGGTAERGTDNDASFHCCVGKSTNGVSGSNHLPDVASRILLAEFHPLERGDHGAAARSEGTGDSRGRDTDTIGSGIGEVGVCWASFEGKDRRQSRTVGVGGAATDRIHVVVRHCASVSDARSDIEQSYSAAEVSRLLAAAERIELLAHIDRAEVV